MKKTDVGSKIKNTNGFNFDFNKLMPFMGLFGNGGVDLSGVVSLLNGGGDKNKHSQSNFNPLNMITSLLSNSVGAGNILKLFKSGLNKNTQIKKDLKTTDFEIKNYTRVE